MIRLIGYPVVGVRYGTGVINDSPAESRDPEHANASFSHHPTVILQLLVTKPNEQTDARPLLACVLEPIGAMAVASKEAPAADLAQVSWKSPAA